jgi:hypothetical protein
MSEDEERKLVYGLIFSIKNVCDKLSDNPAGYTACARAPRGSAVGVGVLTRCPERVCLRARASGTPFSGTGPMCTSCTFTRRPRA